MSVYAAFGVSLPHSSSALRSCGYEVSLADIQPGDIVCYSGHAAIYAGNNTIVHASTEATGIKYTSPVDYRPIITIRRIF
jgi:cell wall-associated NlpC family hydrolase